MNYVIKWLQVTIWVCTFYSKAKEIRPVCTRSIVLIDDEFWTLVSLRKLFHRPDLAFEVLESFQNGQDALDFILKRHPDYVFLDIKMPGIDGLTLAQKLRDLHVPTRIIIISAFADFEYAQEAIRRGVTDYITKPITADKADQLLQKLRSMSERDAGSTPPESGATFERMLEYVQNHYTERLKLQDLASMFFVNDSYCSALFSDKLGVPFTTYITNLRLERAVKLLTETALPIKTVSIEAGYPDYLYFSRLFHKRFGVSPSEYRDAYRQNG